MLQLSLDELRLLAERKNVEGSGLVGITWIMEFRINLLLHMIWMFELDFFSFFYLCN